MSLILQIPQAMTTCDFFTIGMISWNTPATCCTQGQKEAKIDMLDPGDKKIYTLYHIKAGEEKRNQPSFGPWIFTNKTLHIHNTELLF